MRENTCRSLRLDIDLRAQHRYTYPVRSMCYARSLHRDRSEQPDVMNALLQFLLVAAVASVTLVFCQNDLQGNDRVYYYYFSSTRFFADERPTTCLQDSDAKRFKRNNCRVNVPPSVTQEAFALHGIFSTSIVPNKRGSRANTDYGLLIVSIVLNKTDD